MHATYMLQASSQINYFSCMGLSALINLILFLDVYLLLRNPFYPRDKRMKRLIGIGFLVSVGIFAYFVSFFYEWMIELPKGDQ